ncbi:MAG: hypothetical protein ACLS9P_01585 [Haemophilus parainfluenzae]
MAFLGLFYSKSPDNKNGYANAEYDQLFEQALKSLNEKERSEIYLKLSEKIQQENLALPLFQYTTPVYISPTIMGAKKNPVGSFIEGSMAKSGKLKLIKKVVYHAMNNFFIKFY